MTIAMLFMLWKKGGGWRVIGLLATFYRVWARARIEVVQAWAAAHDAPFWVVGSGGSAEDAAYNISALAEAATTAKHRVQEIAIAPSVDITKAFETLNTGESSMRQYSLVSLWLSSGLYSVCTVPPDWWPTVTTHRS